MKSKNFFSLWTSQHNDWADKFPYFLLLNCSMVWGIFILGSIQGALLHALLQILKGSFTQATFHAWCCHGRKEGCCAVIKVLSDLPHELHASNAVRVNQLWICNYGEILNLNFYINCDIFSKLQPNSLELQRKNFMEYATLLGWFRFNIL